MKNANTRFVRVLALVLVVLMVVPAALVGCGSNKANNAAISEALAAAEAARKEAEEAKAAADAAAAEAAAKAAAEAQKALEEANKKAEEAIKAAEQAKKDAEQAQKDAEQAQKDAEAAKAEAAKTTAAPATTAPVTTAAPTGDMKIVSDYAYSVLSNKDLDFLKTYFTYAYGKSEKDLEKTDFDVKGTLSKAPENPIYTSVDLANMEVLYDATVVAIYQANTVDYINQLVSNFVNTITTTKTYAEHVLAAYEAIDFASNYDVVDVVYAYQLLVKALADAKAAGNITGTTTTYLDELEEKLTKYGENNVDVINAIAVEYYRYTGADIDTSIDADITDIEDDDILYDLMYEAAAEIVSAVQDLIKNNGAEYDDNGLMILDAAKLPYDPKIESAVANVVKKYTQWNTKYFVNADDADLAGYYEDFRKAFVGETYILKGEADFVWEALVAFEARATELLAAVAEYESGFKTELNSVAKPTTIKYWNYIEKVAKVNAALEAWKLKYNFEDDENGNVDPNVTKIIEKYAAYETNAAIVAYFVYLEKSAAAVNASAFLNAYKEDLHDNKSVMFTYSKYGSAVASVLDWYYGKEKNGTRDSANAFEAIAPNDDKDFFGVLDDADDTYTVSKLIAVKDVNILEMFERAFDLDVNPDDGKDKDAFATMLAVYTKLREAKEDADDINDDIEEYLEKGVSVKVETDLVTLLGAKYAEIFDPDVEEEDKYNNLAGAVAEWIKEAGNKDVLTVGDANFLEMIDWANIETLYDNYNGSTKSIKEAAVEVALMYIAWKGEYKAEDEIITYKGMDFEDLDPVEINIYSYDFIEKVLDLYSALDVKNAAAVEIEVPINNDDDYVITLKDVANYCVELRTHFYSIVDTLQINMYNHIYNDFPILSSKAGSALNSWRNAVESNAPTLAFREAYYNAVVNAGNRVNANNDPNEIIKPAILEVLKDTNFTRKTKNMFGNYNNVPADAANADGFKTVSYQFAVYSVNPLSYATLSAEGKVLSFDSAKYKAALTTAIESMYKSYMVSYLKQSYATAGIVDTIALTTLNTGLWTIVDDIVIADEEYAFEINTNKLGTAWELEILDADDEFVKHVSANVVTVEFEPKKNEKYTITLTATLDKGVLKIAPAITSAPTDSTKTVYDFVEGLDKDYFEEKGELPYFAFDVRDYAEQIAANGDKVTNIVLLGGKKATLDTFTAAQFTSLYSAEKTNLFQLDFAKYTSLIYNSGTSYASWILGKYVSNVSDKKADAAITTLTTLLGADIAEAVVVELVKISQAAYQLCYGMTPDMNTLDDIKDEFEAFALEVNHKLDDLGVAYTVGAEKITITGLK